MPKIQNRALLERILGQCDSDNENVRHEAFNKARAMLQKDGLRFVDLLRMVPEGKQAEQTKAKRPAPPSSRRTDEATDRPYIHDRVAGRFSRRHNGKRVIRGTVPPPGSKGRVRVLRDDDAFGMHTVILSMETATEIYEPYEQIYNLRHQEGRESYAQLAEASRSGATMRYY